MNKSEHILTVIGEEGGEVAKEISKALRFGLDDRVTLDPHGPRGTEGPTNREKISAEFIDMLGAYQLAVMEGILPDIGLANLPVNIKEMMKAKANRIRSYMDYAVRVDALTDIETVMADFKAAAQGVMACGHQIGDLIGAPGTITKCGACLASIQARPLV